MILRDYLRVPEVVVGAGEPVSFGINNLSKDNGLDLPATVAHGEIEIDVRPATLCIGAIAYSDLSPPMALRLARS